MCNLSIYNDTIYQSYFYNVAVYILCVRLKYECIECLFAIWNVYTSYVCKDVHDLNIQLVVTPEVWSLLQDSW